MPTHRYFDNLTNLPFNDYLHNDRRVHMTPQEQALLDQIESAFDGVKLGEGISLNMTEYLDDYGMTPEFAKRARFDERNDWRAITDATLEKFQVTFCFTDLLGYRFYAAPYMRWCIRHRRTSSNFIGDATVYAMDPSHYQFKDTPFTQWFTPAQIAAILAFLDYCVEQNASPDDTVAAKHAAAIRAQLAG